MHVAVPCRARGCIRCGRRRSTCAITVSTGSGIRLLTWNELHRGDYVYIDRELLKVDELPKGPDEDTSFQDVIVGQRICFEDTTAEGHALLRPVYKVDVLPPGTAVVPNGLPVFDLVDRNDDGGPTFGRTRS